MEFVLERVSPYSVSETVDRVKKSLKENGFGTLFELNFKDKFAEHEIAFKDDFYVLEVCNPGQAKKILDIARHVGYFLPCKVVVFNEDETVKVGMLKPTSMIHMLSDDVDTYDIAHEVEVTITKSLEEAIR
jgi:uncharacterized protein (DUF302 family)